MEKTLTRNNAIICILVFLIAFTSIMPIGTSVAMAVEDSGSNVLVDLNKAENFNVDYYPYNPTDNSLHVIHVAESTDKELLVYVYQPTGDSAKIKASSISISTALDNKNIKPDLYGLEFLNCSGVFYKYKVKDFVVSDSTTRVYSIVSILRPFIDGADEEAGFDNTISEVPYPVAKEFIFYSGQDDYQMQVLDVVEITDKFVGYVVVSTGVDPGLVNYVVDYCSNFVAFSCDKEIDKLLEADVYYLSQSFSETYLYDSAFDVTLEEKIEFGTSVSSVATLTSEDKLTYSGEGLWWAENVLVDRIQKTADFIDSTNVSETVYTGALIDVSKASKITDDGLEALKNKQWVLRFSDTERRYRSDINTGASEYYSTLIGDVSILRLKFETDGEVYNLGVVDNKQTGSDKPINEWEYNVDFKLPSWLDGLKDVAKLILLIVFIILMLPVVYYVLKFIVWVFKSIAKAIKRSSKKTRTKKEK